MRHWIVPLTLALAMAIAWPAVDASAREGAAKQISVIFRYDDYSTRSNTEAEQAVIGIFRKHGLPITFGVIPFPSAGRFVDPNPQQLLTLTEEKTRLLVEAMQAGIVEVALHGYSHQSVSGKYDEGLSEFAGADFDTQLSKLKEGKSFLEGIIGRDVDIFIPPYETYDANTLRALEQAGFRCLAAGRYGLETESPGLKLIPSTCLMPWLEATIEAAEQSSEREPLIVVLLHDTDFVEVDARRGWISLPQFDAMMGRLAARDDVSVINHSQAMELIGDRGGDRFAAYKRFNEAFSLLPDFIRPLETGVYLSAEKSDSLVATGWVFTSAYFALLVLVVAAVAFLIGKLVFRRRLWAAVMFYGALLASAAGIAVVLRFFMRNYKGPSAIAILAAGCLGAWLAYRSFKKKSAAESEA